MKSKLTLVIFSCLLISTVTLGQQGRGRGGGQPARGLMDVTVEAIPGVVAAGAEWSSVWSGWGIVADGIMGTSDGSLLVAQEDLNTVMKLDTNDQASVFIANTRSMEGAVKRNTSPPSGPPDPTLSWQPAPVSVETNC